MSAQQPQNIGYGFSSPLIKVNPEPIVSNRDPMVSDRAQIGTTWINQSTNTFWVLTSIADAISYWELGGGSGAVDTITTDAGVAIPSAGNINVVGGLNTNTAAAGSTLTVNLNNNIDVPGYIATNTHFEATNSANTADRASLFFQKDRNNTIVQTGDALGSVVFMGYDGTDYEEAAFVEAQVVGTPGANKIPGKLLFGTKPDSANPVTNRMVIDAPGNVTIFKPDSGYSLMTGNDVNFRNEVADANGVAVDLTKSRAGATVQDLDELGAVQFRGSDGSAFVTGAYISAAVNGAVSAGNVPGALVFGTAAVGSAATDRMGILANGSVKINTPDAGYALEADGDIAGQTVFATGDNGGVLGATALTNAVELVTSGTPTLVDSASVTGANTGYLKMYVGTQAIYVPYWT